MSRLDAQELREEFGRLVAATQRHLELEESFGVERMPFDANRAAALREQRRASAKAASGGPDKAAALAALESELQSCNLCQ